MHTKPIQTRTHQALAATAIAAVVASMTLTACGPHDGQDANAPAGAAPTTPVAATVPAPTQQPPGVAGALPAPPVQQVPPSQPVVAATTDRIQVVADRNTIGSVERIEPIRSRPQGSGAGAVIGGVLGAVVGNQFGHSAGRAAMTGLGAVGGAVAGNNIERNHREGVTGYRVSIRLDNGSTRSYERTDVSNLQVGDRVHIDANSFHRV